MITRLIDERINQLEVALDLSEGTPVMLVEDMLDWLEEIRKQVSSPQKFTIKVAPHKDGGYLGLLFGKGFIIGSSKDDDRCQTHFTQAEINQFQGNPDLAIEWDKAIIEPVREED